MKKYVTLLALFMFIFSFNGTLTAQNYSHTFVKVTNIPENKAVFYIYRYNFKRDRYHFTVHANQGLVSDVHIYKRGYLVYFADPGKTEIWAQAGKKKFNIEIDAEAGKSYFIKANLKRDMVLPIPNISFILTPESQALKEISKCKLMADQ